MRPGKIFEMKVVDALSKDLGFVVSLKTEAQTRMQRS